CMRTHAGQLMAVLAIGDSSSQTHLCERTVLIVVKQQTRRGVACDKNIRIPVVIEVPRESSKAIVVSCVGYSRFLADIVEGPVSVIVIKLVMRSFQTAGTAHHRDAFPLTQGAAPGLGRMRGIKVHVFGNKQINMAIQVVINESAARVPSPIF